MQNVITILFFLATISLVVYAVFSIVRMFRKSEEALKLRNSQLEALRCEAKSKQIQMLRDKYAAIGYNGFLFRTMDEVKQKKITPTNCKNCGAPLHGHKCEYCDTEY